MIEDGDDTRLLHGGQDLEFIVLSHNAFVLFPGEETLDVTLAEIGRDLLADDVGVLLEGRIELVAELGGYLVADMDELTEGRVVERVLLIVAESACICVGVPACDLLR